MKHDPEDNQWINTENQEVDPKTWWLMTLGSIVVVLICAVLILTCA